MPRPTAKSVPAESADVPAETTESAPEAAAEAPKSNGTAKRERHPEVGLKPLQKATPPAPKRGGGVGRSVDKATLETIEALTNDSGEWYLIGTYSNCTPPKGVWETSDIVFTHASRGDGLFDRYAKHDPAAAQAKRQEREARAAKRAQAKANNSQG